MNIWEEWKRQKRISSREHALQSQEEAVFHFPYIDTICRCCVRTTYRGGWNVKINVTLNLILAKSL
jgi:hypothetical protein